VPKLTLILFAASAISLANGQGASSAATNAAVAQFASPDVITRVKAFYSISDIPHIFEQPAVISAAVSLLLTEDSTQRAINLTAPDSAANLAVKQLGYEGWAEYMGELVGVVERYASSMHNPIAIHALLLGGAAPGSGAVAEYAHFGPIALPDLYDSATSPDPHLRASSIAVLGEMLIEDKKAPGSLVPADQRGRAKETVIAGLEDREESGAAPEAMRTLAALHEPGDRELVERAAASSPRPGHRELGRALLSRWGSGH